MPHRRSLSLPITLGVVMIVLVVVLTIGWVLLSVYGALYDESSAGLYWALLSVGATFLALVLAGVITYLSLSIKAINLNRRQSNFIDSVTHELKSPIASLKLYLQTLNRRQVGLQEQAEFCRFMLEDVERLDHLINHVLDAARLDHGGDTDDRQDVELADLLRQCGETVGLRHRTPADVIHVVAPPCRIRSRRGDLEIVFRNLIDNAVKYAGSPPRVDVTLRTDADRLAIVRVRDNGRGIPREQRRKIFGRFVRLGSDLERTQPGTGLGLYIVRTLVQRLGGSVAVYDANEAPADQPATGASEGTIFEVRLPREE